MPFQKQNYTLAAAWIGLILSLQHCDGSEADGPVCGNGVKELGEICDGDCPETCDDDNACTVDAMQGNPSTCDATCIFSPITQCQGHDMCCPAGCSAENDDDCSLSCGNGKTEERETCDPQSSCPMSCDDNQRCTLDLRTGSVDNCNVDCSHQSIVQCIEGDGCCPSGCSTDTDKDCAAVCDNGKKESGETCDPPDSCPKSCNDFNACTWDVLTGSSNNCDVDCAHQLISWCADDDGCCPAGCVFESDNDCSESCGNGDLDDGESCDPPSSCPKSCEDQNNCTVDVLTGSPNNCNVNCSHTAITLCGEEDSCCPAGCGATSDPDCSASCDNGKIDNSETCDPIATCPTNCDDGNNCTYDQMTGSPENCNVECSHSTITQCVNGDRCCPSGCDVTKDSDCVPSCPQGAVDIGQIRDPDDPVPVSPNCRVLLTGVVVTTPVFHISSIDSFYVQEPSGGAYSGIFIYCTNVDASSVSQGDVVSIEGQYVEYNGTSEIKASKVTRTGSAGLPAPIRVTPVEINDGGNLSEKYEGVLVKIENVITTQTPFVSTDGKDYGDFLVASPGDPSAELIIGRQIPHAFSCPEEFMGYTCSWDYRAENQTLFSVVGVMSYSFDHFRLQPRSIGDIEFDQEIDQFRLQLKESVIDHVALSYNTARDRLFSSVDNVDGKVQCVYTGEWVTTSGIPSIDVMQTEHTWPQSWGADQLPMRSDLNHLFPVLAGVNQERLNHPFGEVVTVSWSQGGSSLGLDSTGREVFEPRDAHKGDAARAMFYFAVRYDRNIPAYLEDVLRVWNQQDPPDTKEIDRADAIEVLQNKRNPFIDHPEYVDQIGDF